MRSQNLKDYKKPESWNRGASFLKEILWIIIFKPMVSNNIPGTFGVNFYFSYLVQELENSTDYIQA